MAARKWDLEIERFYFQFKESKKSHFVYIKLVSNGYKMFMLVLTLIISTNSLDFKNLE